MKFAGGDILSSMPAELMTVEDAGERRVLLRRMMPGFCLVERLDLMRQAMGEGLDAIDALLAYLQVTHQSVADEEGRVNWQSSRREKGWIVPIATGFHGITELAQAENQRDPDTPHRFAESIVTLGEFIMPYRINDLDNMLWHYHTDLANNLYLCRQNKPVAEF
jgi:CRISPR-associated protein Csy2